MSPSKVSRRIVLDRLAWVERMLAQIRSLPLAGFDAFMADARNAGSAESCLRRALEALFDAGRHVLAKGFGRGDVEYREIAEALASMRVFSPQEGALLKVLAGYRNRLVHFYHEVSARELYEICVGQLGDLEKVRDAFRTWMAAHPEMVDTNL